MTTTIKTPAQDTERDQRGTDGLRSMHADSTPQGERRGFWHALAEAVRESRYPVRNL